MSAAGAPLVRLSGVVKRFGGGAAPVREVLAGVDLELARGEAVVITGPSGSGKSTLLHVLGALSAPDAGEVSWEGTPLYARDAEELARFRNRELGFVFQQHHLLPQCTALENALVPTLVERDAGRRASAEARARELLERVGLADRLGQRPSELSGGEAQRVAFVRALVNQPRLVLADEPTGSLDQVTADTIAELLVELFQAEGTTLVVVTHAESLAARLPVRYELDRGLLARRAGR